MTTPEKTATPTEGENLDGGPNSWWDVVGPVVRFENLLESVQNDIGLIALTTSDGVKCCPVGQFPPDDTITIDEDGRRVPRIDDGVRALWWYIRYYDAGQLGFDEWSAARSVLYPLVGQDQSLIQQIFAAGGDMDELRKIFTFAFNRTIDGAAWNGVELIQQKPPQEVKDFFDRLSIVPRTSIEQS